MNRMTKKLKKKFHSQIGLSTRMVLQTIGTVCDIKKKKNI